MLQRDAERFATVADHANWCPLGSGAIAGTTLPIDREFSARALGFVDLFPKPVVTDLIEALKASLAGGKATSANGGPAVGIYHGADGGGDL